MKKYKALKIVLIILLVLIIFYCGFKSLLLYKYRVYKRVIDPRYLELLRESTDIINIELREYNESTSNFESLRYPSLEEEFFLDEYNSRSDSLQRFQSYVIKDEEDNLKATFKIGTIEFNNYDILTSDNYTAIGFKFLPLDREELLKKNEVNNEIDLMKYITKHYKDKVNIFSNTDEIEFNYLIKTFTNIFVPVSKITFITGDLNGYMYTLVNDNYYEIHLINGKENYVISFINSIGEKYFTLDDIKEFLSNINFN